MGKFASDGERLAFAAFPHYSKSVGKSGMKRYHSAGADV
jgi:hypothetical protein